jgi:hypothetical protein
MFGCAYGRHVTSLLQILDLRKHPKMGLPPRALGGFGYLPESRQHRQHPGEVQRIRRCCHGRTVAFSEFHSLATDEGIVDGSWSRGSHERGMRRWFELG